MVFKYTFQHYIDISTSATTLTMLKIRAGGKYALSRTKHLWGAFKYAKLGKISIKLVPASTLPVDPLGLSYADTDPQTVDPRDQLNPGLVRITNGEPVFDDFNGLSDEALEQMYTNTMLDPRWSKFMLQSGFKRTAVPLYWTVGQLAQTSYPDMIRNLPRIHTDELAPPASLVTSTTSVGSIDNGFGTGEDGYNASASPAFWNRADTDPRGLFQTGHKGRLGWMPTDNWEWFHNSNGANFSNPLIQPMLSPEVITVVLPKAYKTLYYYRLFISETILFSGLKNTGINTAGGDEYRALDNFIYNPWPFAQRPELGVDESTDTHRSDVDPMNDGS